MECYNRTRPWRAEDYLKAIYAMLQQGLRPRVRELARRLGIKPSSVVEYLRKLDELGYIVYMKGGNIELTDKGKAIAEKIYERHIMLTEFLVAIGVPRDIAEIDACYMEHGLHDITINKIMEFLSKHLKGGKNSKN